jgi:hypothetical protein
MKGSLGVLALCLVVASARSQADIYVSPKGSDIYDGRSPIARGASGPFATLDRARLEVRKLKKTRPVLVQIAGGTYRLSSTIVFEPADSGAPGAPVIYRAAPGQTPEFLGSQEVKGWTSARGGEFRSPWSRPLPPQELFINGARMPRSVWPKKGYLWIAGSHAGTSSSRQDQFLAEKGDVPLGWDWTGVEAMIVHNWGISRIPVKRTDPRSGLVTLAGSTWHPTLAELKPGVWYRFENAPLSTITTGEWRYDHQKREIVVRASAAGAKAEVPVLDTLVSFRGNWQTGDAVMSIHFEGLTFGGTSYPFPPEGLSIYQAEATIPAAIHLARAEQVVFSRCRIERTGGYGIEITDGSKGVVVEKSVLRDLGAGGIKIGTLEYAGDADLRRYPVGNTVSDSVIQGGGRIHPAGIGVWIGHSGSNKVLRNTISDLYYSGVSLGWRWDSAFSPAKNNLVADNHIYNLGQGVLSDMAGIYTLGESQGTVLRGNRIHDVTRSRYGGWGIYFDESSRGVVAEDNVVYRTEDAPFHQHYGKENIVRRNIFASGKNAQIQLSNHAKSGLLTIEDNVFVWEQGRLFESGVYDQVVFRRNTYWRRKNPAGIEWGAGVNAEKWRKREPDMKVADPGFRDIQGGDFRRQGASLAAAAVRTTSAVDTPRTFPPAPGERPYHMNEGFESLTNGQMIPGWSILTAPGSSIGVSDLAAASGSKSVLFQDGGQGESWMPHAFVNMKYEQGQVKTSFKIRMEAGGAAVFAWRDTNPWYTTGPSVEFAGGKIKVDGKEAGSYQSGEWWTVEIVAGVGTNLGSTYRLTLVSGRGPSRTQVLPMPQGFRTLGWIGFTSDSTSPGRFFVDDILVAPLSMVVK